MKVNNPFLVRGYIGPEYFCDREKETAELFKSLMNEGDVTLIAPRRIGKTGLIHHVFNRLSKDFVTVYLDVYATRNLADFTRAFASAVVGSLDTKVEKAMSNVAKFFKSCRPTVTPQEIGLPKFSFDIVPSNAEATLQETFEYIRKREKRMFIAIDEFQQVLEYPERGTEALLRSYMQFLPGVHFIFSGSRQHLMREMFLSAKHPFYQSTDILSLQPVDRAAYSEFAGAFFAKARKPFDADAFDRLYDRFDGVTWYVQMVLRKLWADGTGLPGVEAVARAVEDIVDTRKYEFLDLYQSQNGSSRRLLRALADEGCVAEPLSGVFIAKHGLRATSTVASTLKELVANDLVYRTEAGYAVYDRFFAVWLKGIS